MEPILGDGFEVAEPAKSFGTGETTVAGGFAAAEREGLVEVEDCEEG